MEAAPVSAPVAPESAPTEAAPVVDEPWRKAKHKVQVNGAEAELGYDELVKGYQTGKASDEKFQKAANTEKQMGEFLTAVKADPNLWLKFAEQTGIYDQVLSTAEQRLVKKYEMEALRAQDPERFELLMAKEERDTLKSERQKFDDDQKLKERNQNIEIFGKEIETEIIETLQQQGMKPTPRTIARAAEYLLASLDRPTGRIKASEAFDRVKRDYATDLKDYMQGIGDDALASFLGDDVRKRLRGIEVSQLRKGPGAGGKPTQTESQPAQRDAASAPSVDDWFKKREEFFRKSKR